MHSRQFVTPEYNYSIPGVLKNAIDWASRPYGDSAWSGKPAAIMGASIGMIGTARAQYHLRQVMVFLDMFPINQPEVMIGNASKRFDANGNLTDDTTRDFIRQLLQKLVEWTRRIAVLSGSVPPRAHHRHAGGRAAEEIVYGTKTTGAESDIEQATGLARRMVTRWGMSHRLGLVQLAPRENPYLSGPNGYAGYAGEKPFSEETAEAIDAEVRRIIAESHEEAKRLLSAHRRQLDALAAALVARETLSEEEILQVTGLPRAPQLDTGLVPVPGAVTKRAS
jgi:hypothetical protein